MDLYGARWFPGNGSKDRMKTHASLIQAACEVQMQDPDSGFRHFGCYRTWDDAAVGLQALGGNRRHVFEVITHGRQVKPYLDLDGKTLPPGVGSIRELCERTEVLVKAVFLDDYGVPLPASAFVWLQSPRQTSKAVSLHLVIASHAPQYVFQSNHQDDPRGAAHLALRLRQMDPDGVGAVVDVTVYTKDREMRMCGSSKFLSSHSVLAPLDSAAPASAEGPVGVGAAFTQDSVITWLDEDVVELDVPTHIPRTVLRERRGLLKPSEATPLAEEHAGDLSIGRMLELLRARLHPTATHDKAHGAEDAADPAKGIKFTYKDRSEPCYTKHVHTGKQNLRCYVDPASGDVFAKCYSSSCQGQPAHRLGSSTPPSDAHLSRAAFVRMPFLVRADPDNPDAEVLDQLVRRWTAPPVSPLLWTGCGGGLHKGLALCSPMGTGKSTFLDNLLSDPAFAGASILVISYRQTLALEQARKLRNHGFVNYMTCKGDLADRHAHPRVICQVESLGRLTVHAAVPPAPFDLVILDESESVLRHFASPTVRAPGETMGVCVHLLRQAKRVLTMDAFWGAATHEFLHAAGVPNQLVVNQHPGPQRTFAFTDMYSAWADKIASDLSEGRNVVVASMSTVLLERLVRDMLARGVVEPQDVLTHTSKTGDDVKAALEDVDALWRRHRLVAFSPTISAGVDFSTVHFHRMYFYACTMSCTPLGALQMTGRVRKLGDPRVECLASPLMRMASVMAPVGARLARPMSPQAMATFLMWVDDKLRQHVLTARQNPVPGNTGPQAAVKARRTHAALVSVLSHAEAERHNALFRFFQDFKDMAEGAGHVVCTDALAGRVATLRSEMDAVDAPTRALRLVAAPDASTAEDWRELKGRIFASTASEEDKYMYYKHTYKLGWGVDVVTAEFVATHGTATRSPEVSQLVRLLYPQLHVAFDADTGRRVSLLRVPLIAQTLDALGFRSVFDTDHVVHDLMEVWGSRVVTTEMFARYVQNKALFCGRHGDAPAAWTCNAVVKAVNMVLATCGVRLKPTTSRAGKEHVRVTTYRLDEDAVATMVELVKLKTRTLGCTVGNAHAEAVIAANALPLYGHLVAKADPARYLFEPELEEDARDAGELE